MTKKVTFAFGRFQGPTHGHKKLIDKAISHAEETGGEHRIYTSQSQDSTKNPIPYDRKVGHLRKLFPNANVVRDPEAKTAFHVAKKLSAEGVEHATMIVGQDREEEFREKMSKYVKHPDAPDYDPKKHIALKSFKVVSAGQRDPDAKGVEGASGTKMREFVKKGDFKSFAQNTPTKNAQVARGIFNDMKKNLKEERMDEIGELNHEKFGPMLDTFVQFASNKLGIKSLPTHELKKDEMATSFAAYNPSDKHMIVVTKNRHPMDIYRSVAHELVHHKQNEDGRLGKDISKEGATGSDIENEANSDAGKVMRWYAKENPSTFKSGYVVESYLDEGINDPAKMKAVFLAGGPGSGKDFIMNRTLAGHGMSEINSDNALEHLMKKQGLDLKMPPSEDFERNIVRGKAKNITKEKERLAIAGRRGLIINGTADDPDKIATIKSQLESSGYQTKMLFVHTNNRVSKQRNLERGLQGGRKIPDGTDKDGRPDGSRDIRTEKWEAAQEAKEKLKKLFGNEHFKHVDNSEDLRQVSPERKKEVDDEHNELFKHYKKFASTPVESPAAKEYETTEKKKRSISDIRKTRATAMSQRPNEAMPVYQPNASEMEQAKRLGIDHVGGGQFGKKTKGETTISHVSKNGQLTMNEDLRKWFSKTDPKGGWKRYNSKGEAIGPCAREPGEPKPKCMSNEKAASLSKKERASAVAAKRRHDPDAERKGKPINVSNFGKGKISEEETNEACWDGYTAKGMKKKGSKMVPNCVPVEESKAAAIAAATAISKKKSGNYDKEGFRVKPYKNSDAPNVKSNDERRIEMKKEEYLQEKNMPTNPELWSRAKSMARQKFDVYPSAYANGWASKWYKSKGGGWRTKTDEAFENFMEENTPSDREWGKDSLTKIYKEMTPGQTAPENPLFEKKKMLKKKLTKEDNMPPLGYEIGNSGIGPTFGIVRSPNGLGSGYSLPMTSMAESIQSWASSEKTQNRFIEKYGDLAEQKLYEAATRLNNVFEEVNSNSKSFSQLREGFDKGVGQMGTVNMTNNKDESIEEETPAWQRKEGKNPEGGLNRKGIASYRAKNPGSKLSMAVTTKPSKLKPGSKAANRRKSFCARMGGMKKRLTSAKTANDPDSRINKSLRKWNCEE